MHQADVKRRNHEQQHYKHWSGISVKTMRTALITGAGSGIGAEVSQRVGVAQDFSSHHFSNEVDTLLFRVVVDSF